MTTHRAVELSALVRERWPVLAAAFSVVASPRVRNQATVGGVLADADYASDPPAMLQALGARVIARSVRGEREVPIEELILGYYETCIAADELLVEVRVPGGEHAPSTASSARARTRTGRASASRPAGAGAELRVVVGAVAERPQHFPDAVRCERAATAPEVAHALRRARSSRSPTSRGSADYRRRVIAVEVRRALEELAA